MLINPKFSKILNQLNDLYSIESPFEGNIFYEHHQNLIVNDTLEKESNDKDVFFMLFLQNSN